MKKIFTLTILIALSCQIFGQSGQGRRAGGAGTPAIVPPPVASREVSGIIKDESGQIVIGALVTLKSKIDTIRTSTNEDGIFIIKNVKYNVFNITVSSIGSITFIKKYSYSDATKRVVLDPIILKTKSNELNEVQINGTPSITYKTDTVEYRASDYKVRENATLDELLKKMEGMEVGSDGTLTHQGQQVMRAKLNGKEYAGGNVAQAIQNLPADIIEKVQIVDDYGDQAARTGIKDGDPQKILNITTKPDKSVGTTGRLTAQAGNDDRYNAQLFVQRINANQQLGVIGNIRNTVNGVASTGVQGGATNGGGGGTGVGAGARGGGSPGTTQAGSPTFNYRDQWSKDMQVNSSYAYNFNNNNSINNSYGQRYTTYGPSNFINQNTRQTNSKGHQVHFEMEVNLDSANFLQITPNFGYTNSTSSSNSLTDNVNNYTTGFEHLVDKGISTSLSTNTNYGLTAFFLHVFKKPKRNFSIQVSASNQNSQSNGGSNKDYRHYADSTLNVLTKDSLVNLLTDRSNKNSTYHTTVTYVEPISLLSQIEFRGDLNRSNNNSRSVQDTVLANGQLKELTALSNIYNYSTTQERLTLNYRFNGTKVNLTLGATAIPYNLSGTKIDNSTSLNTTTSRSSFRVIPAFRFAYTWSRTERFQLTYSGANNEPSFNEIQPFTDRSSPLNPIVGNPNLKPSFNNSINASYNNYIANSKITIALNLNATTIDNEITTNTLQIRQLIQDNTDPAKRVYQNINEVHYVNLNGAQSVVGRYTFAKQLDDRRYNLSLNGNITYSYTPAMSNNLLYHSTDWRFDERFGPRINPTDNIEINPYVAYDVDRTFTTALNSRPTYYRTTQLAVDGKMYFLKTFQINYSARKIFVSGISNSTNPLVINTGFQKEFFKKKNLVFTFDVYDLLHQNNFIQQTVTATGVTNTVSNSLSRYFLVGLRLNLQQWSGRPMRKGKEMQRRGDGSFIYN
ncbi:outer membrane beta-barrel protein [Mucilaginibacter sp.]|uniref:outer membrane beta-barrel protein n=1 Tax=Mucilaginibacter sp. TaxID=1882438 RepID=UPI002629DECD|nr:outer membrane beta-barrel protein [Mucilaginibacter sp.]MDB4925280.1 hypothetical protein [Mucilaginibacter sp.]